jgi:hypothetical protein
MFTDVLTDYTAGDNDGWFRLLEDSVVNLISLQLCDQWSPSWYIYFLHILTIHFVYRLFAETWAVALSYSLQKWVLHVPRS